MHQRKRMIPKSGYRFSERIMHQRKCMIPKSGYRFSEEIMHQRKNLGFDPIRFDRIKV
jgi:hypothetical protein